MYSSFVFVKDEKLLNEEIQQRKKKKCRMYRQRKKPIPNGLSQTLLITNINAHFLNNGLVHCCSPLPPFSAADHHPLLLSLSLPFTSPVLCPPTFLVWFFSLLIPMDVDVRVRVSASACACPISVLYLSAHLSVFASELTICCGLIRYTIHDSFESILAPLKKSETRDFLYFPSLFICLNFIILGHN